MLDPVLNLCVAYQDYVWFLALLGWVGAGLLWWRVAHGNHGWAWLGWSAGAGIAEALLELVMLATPVRPTPEIPPHATGDALLGAATAVQLAGWIFTAARPRAWRWGAWLVPVALAAVRWHEPEWANRAGALLAVAAAAVWAPKLFRKHPAALLALVVAALAIALSAHGVLADAMGQARSQVEVSRAGFIGAVMQVLATVVAGVTLVRLGTHDLHFAKWAAHRADVALVLRVSAAWLLAGLLLATGASMLAARAYRDSLLARVRAMTALIDRAELARALGPEFRVDEVEPPHSQPSGRESLYGWSHWHKAGAGLSVRAAIRRMHELNPDVRNIAVRARAGGTVVLCLQAQERPEDVGRVFVEGDVDRRFLADWGGKVFDFRGLLDTSYDEVTQTRAPLTGPDDAMLGWLVFDTGVSDWIAVQTQARVLSFVAVFLGLGVAALWLMQRRRERERQVAEQAAELAISSDRMKTSFLAKVSHELRTPLQNILGVGELLRSELPAPEHRRRTDVLVQQGQLLLRMVNDLIDLAAIEAGMLTLAVRPLAMPAVLVAAAEALRPRAAAKGLDYSVTALGDAGTLAGDADRLRQILTNLVGNAVKFTRRGRVAVEIATAPAADGRVTVRIAVADTGPGIPAEELDRLFRRFGRLAGTAHHEGAGLGLAIVRGLCAQMEGGVKVESDGRTGSRFEAWVLLAPTTVPPAPEVFAPDSPPGLSGRRVLIADDNPHVRLLFVEYLTSLGAQCWSAADGAEAWALLQRESFDAAVLDLSMPELDGCTVAQKVRAGVTRGGLKLIAASAHARTADRAAALAAGFDVHLVKPVALVDLARCVAPEAAALPVPDELRKRLREAFRREAAAETRETEALFAAADWPGLRAKAHYLKNSAFAIDDPVLFAAMGRLEDAARERAGGDAEAAWRECRRALEKWLPPPP